MNYIGQVLLEAIENMWFKRKDKHIGLFKHLFKRSGIGVEPLKKELHSLWTSFLESVSSNMKDYLSLEHLGIILHHLSSQGKFKS